MQISHYFQEAIQRQASDLHLVSGSIPAIRVDGDLAKLSDEILNDQELREELKLIIKPKILTKFESDLVVDFSQEIYGGRFRINLHYQEGKIGLTARLIPETIPGPSELRFNEDIYRLTHFRDGLILVTGTSGSGKSTTLAAMIDIINQERRSHIITIEDPIEYIFKEKQSIIEQREIGRDTKSFSSALKYALRQDPNIIMVGEMRDLETISLALTAAETGHLVLSTLHTATAPETITRIVDTFPAHQQQQILNQLSSSLRAVITQQLLPKFDSGRVAAREIMVSNNAIASLIRSNKINQILTAIQTGQNHGMITMNKSINQLLDEGMITSKTAQNRKRRFDTKVSYY